MTGAACGLAAGRAFRCVCWKPRPGFTNGLCDRLAWDEHKPPQREAGRPAPHLPPGCPRKGHVTLTPGGHGSSGTPRAIGRLLGCS